MPLYRDPSGSIFMSNLPIDQLPAGTVLASNQTQTQQPVASTPITQIPQGPMTSEIFQVVRSFLAREIGWESAVSGLISAGITEFQASGMLKQWVGTGQPSDQLRRLLDAGQLAQIDKLVATPDVETQTVQQIRNGFASRKLTFDDMLIALRKKFVEQGNPDPDGQAWESANQIRQEIQKNIAQPPLVEGEETEDFGPGSGFIDPSESTVVTADLPKIDLPGGDGDGGDGGGIDGAGGIDGDGDPRFRDADFDYVLGEWWAKVPGGWIRLSQATDSRLRAIYEILRGQTPDGLIQLESMVAAALAQTAITTPPTLPSGPIDIDNAPSWWRESNAEDIMPWSSLWTVDPLSEDKIPTLDVNTFRWMAEQLNIFEVDEVTGEEKPPPLQFNSFEDAAAKAPPGFEPTTTTSGFWTLIEKEKAPPLQFRSFQEAQEKAGSSDFRPAPTTGGFWTLERKPKAEPVDIDQEISRLILEDTGNGESIARAIQLDAVRDRINQSTGLSPLDAAQLAMSVARTPEEARNWIDALVGAGTAAQLANTEEFKEKLDPGAPPAPGVDPTEPGGGLFPGNEPFQDPGTFDPLRPIDPATDQPVVTAPPVPGFPGSGIEEPRSGAGGFFDPLRPIDPATRQPVSPTVARPSFGEAKDRSGTGGFFDPLRTDLQQTGVPSFVGTTTGTTGLTKPSLLPEPPTPQQVQAAFNTQQGQPGYDPNLDLDKDGFININDITKATKLRVEWEQQQATQGPTTAPTFGQPPTGGLQKGGGVHRWRDPATGKIFDSALSPEEVKQRVPGAIFVPKIGGQSGAIGSEPFDATEPVTPGFNPTGEGPIQSDVPTFGELSPTGGQVPTSIGGGTEEAWRLWEQKTGLKRPTSGGFEPIPTTGPVTPTPTPLPTTTAPTFQDVTPGPQPPANVATSPVLQKPMKAEEAVTGSILNRQEQALFDIRKLQLGAQRQQEFLRRPVPTKRFR